jgi:hypothetical protein
MRPCGRKHHRSDLLRAQKALSEIYEESIITTQLRQ